MLSEKMQEDNVSQRDTVTNIRVKSPTCSELVDNDHNSSQIELNHLLRAENDVKIGRYKSKIYYIRHIYFG